jgi:CelD/BcsL family acetyltransferase involved in cellulose biosynthesis
MSRAMPAVDTIQIATGLPGIAGLERDWRALEAASAGKHHVYQSYDWCATWANTYAAAGGAFEPIVLTGRRNGELVFLMPLMRDGSSRVPLLRWLTEPMGQYGDVLMAAGEDAGAWMAAAFAAIAARGGAAGVYLRHVREDANCWPFLSLTSGPATSPDRAPFLDIAQYPTEETYDGRYSKDQRKRRKRIRLALEEKFGAVDFRLLQPGAEMTAAMAAALSHKQAWIGERSLFTRVLGCPKLLPFLDALSRTGLITTSRLTAGGTAVSWEIGLRFKGTHYGFITAHDTALTDLSPARLHMDLSQRAAIHDGQKIFDLMVPMDKHKESWSTGSVATGDFFRPVSAMGWVIDKAYLRTVRPALRYAYYNAPAPIRHIATAMTAGIAALFLR